MAESSRSSTSAPGGRRRGPCSRTRTAGRRRSGRATGKARVCWTSCSAPARVTGCSRRGDGVGCTYGTIGARGGNPGRSSPHRRTATRRSTARGPATTDRRSSRGPGAAWCTCGTCAGGRGVPRRGPRRFRLARRTRRRTSSSDRSTSRSFSRRCRSSGTVRLRDRAGARCTGASRTRTTRGGSGSTWPGAGPGSLTCRDRAVGAASTGRGRS
mmetsp:Transcript_2017/g.8466  ORF Transcript_2017/g.8466 Transcript_2017/m.8466 type:complete len:213 (+) Transcript_2017:939-1577(+)